VTSTRWSAAPPVSATHSAPSPNSIAEGTEPTRIVSLTSFTSTLIRSTVPSTAFVTHTEPSPIATPEGAAPTVMVS
jgi:hypothetical protein